MPAVRRWRAWAPRVWVRVERRLDAVASHAQRARSAKYTDGRACAITVDDRALMTTPVLTANQPVGCGRAGRWCAEWSHVLVGAGVALSTIAAVLVAVGGLPAVNTDLWWQLVWGAEVAGGDLPSYPAPDGPTLHPLTTGIAAILTPLGSSVAADGMALIAVGGFAALVTLTFLFGREVDSVASGLIAALVLVFSPVLTMTANSVWDVPFAALLVFAGLLETRRPRCGAPVLTVLTVAGLIRPEAWLFTAVYAVYLGLRASPRDRLVIGLSAGIAPALWAIADLVITGDATTSLTYTQDAAAAKELKTGLHNAPPAAAMHLRDLVGWAALVGGPLGLLLLARRPRARTFLMMIILGLAAFMVIGLAGLALRNARYLLMPAVGFAVGFGVLLVRGAAKRRACGRRPLLRVLVTAVMAVGFVVTLPGRLEQVGDSGQSLAAHRDATDDLRRLAASPEARDIVERCPRVFLPDAIAQSIVTHTFGAENGKVVSAQRSRPTRGAFLDGSEHLRGSLAYFPTRDLIGSVSSPPGFEIRVTSPIWELRTRGC